MTSTDILKLATAFMIVCFTLGGCGIWFEHMKILESERIEQGSND